MLQESIKKSNKQPKYSRPRQKIMISYKGNFVLFLIRVWFLSVFRMILSFGCFCVRFASDTFLFLWTCFKESQGVSHCVIGGDSHSIQSVSHSYNRRCRIYLALTSLSWHYRQLEVIQMLPWFDGSRFLRFLLALSLPSLKEDWIQRWHYCFCFCFVFFSWTFFFKVLYGDGLR